MYIKKLKIIYIYYIFSILQNPEILRQLTALQQQMSQHQLRQQQLEVEEKMRKLKEMKQQEEEFDKHLAQTIPVSYFSLFTALSYFCNYNNIL